MLSSKCLHLRHFSFEMRFSPVLFGIYHNKYYRPKYCFTDKEHEVRFKTRKPLKVGDSVSVSATQSSKSHCIQEMFNMMACLKTNEFEQSECSKEIRLFNECNGSQLPVEFRMISKKDQKKREDAQPGNKNLSTMQLNAFLKKFPT